MAHTLYGEEPSDWAFMVDAVVLKLGAGSISIFVPAAGRPAGDIRRILMAH